MKKVLLLLLLLSVGVRAQVVDFSKFATKEDLAKAIKDAQFGNVKPPVIVLPPCEGSPKLVSVYGITQKEFTFNFAGVGVLEIEYGIITGSDTIKGLISPQSDRPTISGFNLNPGEHTLIIRGKSCSSDWSVRNFTVSGSTGDREPPTPTPIPVPTPPTGLINELVLNYTGEGFDAKGANGIDDGGKYLDSFKMPDGTYAITGVRLAMPWYKFETAQGVYEVGKVRELISFVKERGLTLSFCFLPWRKYTDGFIRPDQMMKGNFGDTFYPVDIVAGDPQFNSVIASMADKAINAKIYNAIKTLSSELGKYERAGYISLGLGRGEEFVMANFESKREPVKNTLQLTDFSNEYQTKFTSWCLRRGIVGIGKPNIENGYLNMGNDMGKEYARFCAIMMRRYFDNFTNAIRAGSPSVRSCYFMPSVGTHQNGYELGAYFAYIAENADEWYHSDGSFPYDNHRKLSGINVGRGTFPNKLIGYEIDPVDVGGESGSQINARQFANLVKAGIGRGAHTIHLAMKFFPSSVDAIKSVVVELREAGIGKPFTPPSVTDQNTVVTDVTEGIWANQFLYDDIYNNDPGKYIKQIAPNFWGGVPPNTAGL